MFPEYPKFYYEEFAALRLAMTLRGYSNRSIQGYAACLKDYFDHVPEATHSFNVGAIEAYLVSKYDQGLAVASVNLRLSAIKFFVRHVLKSDERIKIRYAKKPSIIPITLTLEEVRYLLENTRNQKHHLMLSLAYGAGLRVSEVISLKLQDIDFHEGLITVRQAKGNKDRITLLPDKIAGDLAVYTETRKLDDYVFESERGGKLSARTAQKVFQTALTRAGIDKPATFHSLRHSFATHLLENGTSIRYIQELLGHKDIRTTQHYTKVTTLGIKKIKSPLT